MFEEFSDTVRPRERRPLPPAALWLAVGALVVFLGWRRLLSLSVDVGYHLQELEVVRDRWLIGEADKPWLSELWWYPKLSHRAAALLTRFGVGDLDALTLLAVASAAAAWGCMLWWAGRASRLVLAVGLALSLAFGRWLGAWWGGEAVGNFFFPQIVGMGFAWLALTGLAAPARLPAWAFAAGATAATALCGCLHALPTLDLAGALLALLALDVGRGWRHGRRVRWTALAGMAGVAGATVLNPFFTAMRWIAGNDGGITLTGTVSFPLLAGAAGLLLALSAAVWLQRLLAEADADASDRAAEVLAAMGAAVAAAALLQLATFLLLHDGSAYAVRKHGFGVFALLAVMLPLAFVRLRPPRRAARPSPWAQPAPAWWTPAGLILALPPVFLQPSLVDVRGAQRLMADVRAFRPADHAASTLFTSDTTAPVLSYMATIAMLQVRHDDPNVGDLIHTGQPGRPSEVAHIVTRLGDRFDRPACRERPPVGGVVMVRGACAARPAMSFARGGDGVPHLRQGWTAPEQGVWSDGPLATVDLPLPPESRAWRAGWVQLSTFAFTAPQSPRRTATLLVDGAPAETFTFDRATAMTHTFVAALGPAALKRGRVALAFRIADPVTPSSLGLGTDARALGVGLAWINVAPDNRR